jgi:glycerophosphoryl diester phosphodiesterase
VADLTLEELRQLEAGYDFTPDGGQTFPYRGKGLRLATLDELLEALPESHFLIETKPQEGIVDAVIKVIREAGAQDRVLLASFMPAHMDRVREIAPDIATCYDFANGQEMLTALRNGAWETYEPEADVLSLMRRMVKQFGLTPAEIQAIRAKGVRVQVHTVDDPAEMAHYLDLGVDSILTDYPDRLELAITEWRERNAAPATE